MPPRAKTKLPSIPFASQTAWESWLEQHHRIKTELWVQIAKAETGISTVTYAEALESALCYGWIDGQKDSLDDRFWIQRFSPRKPKSKWSKINREKATLLIGQGRMKPAGQVEVDRAKADGRWEAAYASPKNAAVPEDLQKALDRAPRAKAFFEGLDSRNRYAILYRLQDAKKPETRLKRLEKFMAMLKQRQKIHE